MRTCVAIAAVAAACGGSQPAGKTEVTDIKSDKPPVAAKKPHTVRSPNGDRSDPYYWLRDDKRKNPEIIAYLEAENRYTQAQLAPTAQLQNKLYEEIVGRIKQDDASVPTFDNGYWYYRRFEKGKQYAVNARRKGDMNAPELVLFDQNELARDHKFFRLGGYAVSDDNKLAVYSTDVVGRNKYTLRVKDLTTGKLLPDVIKDVAPRAVWHGDGKSFYYIGKEPKTLREYRVYRHVLGTKQTDDELIYEETDKAYFTGLDRSKSRKYVFIDLFSTDTGEIRMIDATVAKPKVEVFLPREEGHEYSLDHLDGRFVVRTNYKAKNFRLIEVAEAHHADRAQWKDLLPASDTAFIHEFALYRGFVAAAVRKNGLRRIAVLQPGASQPRYFQSNESAYAMYLADTPHADATAVRYTYSSLTTPRTTYEHDLKTDKRALLKRQPVLGGFDAANYVTTQVLATARDGRPVPVSLVHHKNTKRDGSAPALIMGYGSYGVTIDPVFNSNVISLLDRGFVYAIAHVRGSQKYGRAWYEDGKLLHKKNTFNDFVDATKHLIDNKLVAAGKVFAIGGSAGGLLMGAVANQAPQLYRGIIAHVPFVDVVTTMLDESIPLTTNEFDEWGNPKEKKYYDYMLSYSPYDQVAAQPYPAMLVTTGLWDSQVQYFEPAKWVARLRDRKTDDHLLLLHTNMKAGHGGKSGRYRRYRETARDYAFILHVLQRRRAPGK